MSIAVKKQMVNTINPDGQPCFIIIADINGTKAIAKAYIKDDDDEIYTDAKAACMADLTAQELAIS